MPLTISDLKRMRDYCDAATKGVWSTKKGDADENGWPTKQSICFVARGQGVFTDTDGGCCPANDQDFIANARQDFPSLIAEHMKLLEEISDAIVRWRTRPDLHGTDTVKAAMVVCESLLESVGLRVSASGEVEKLQEQP